MHNDKFHDLYSAINTLWMIKSTRMRWAGLVTRMGERCSAYRVFMGNMRERDNLEGLGLDGRIILKWIFKK
jgi:hypothetical protein